MKGRIWNILTVVLILGLAVAACKPAATPTPTKAPPTKAPPTPTPVPPTPTPVPEVKDLLNIILEKGKIVGATDPNYAPQSFLDEAGEMVGFDIDVYKEVAKRLGVEMEFVTPDWDLITAGSWGGRWDLSIGSMTPTEERAKVLWFTDPYYYTPAGFAVHKDNTTITTVDDLAGKVIGLCGECTYEYFLQKELVIPIPGYEVSYLAWEPGELKTYPTDANAIEDLRLGDGVRLDAVMSAIPTLENAIKEGVPIKLVGDPVFYEPLSVALDKARGPSEKLLAKLNGIVADMHADGTLTEFSMKWYGKDITKPTPPEAAAAPPVEEANCVLKAVEKVDDYTVKFTFYRPHAPFLAQLASAMMPMVSPAAVQKNLENSFKTPVGTGPMKFVEWKPEDTVTIVRNDDYWGEKAKLDKMVFRVIKDDPARLLELQTGTIDGADSIRPDDIPVVEADPNLALYVRPAFTIGYLGMNTDREPFNKLEVRQAVNYAIDKQAIVDAIAPKTAQSAKEYLPPLMWGYNDEIVDYEYNPEKAKELLAQAGYAEGFELYLWYLPVRRSYFPEAILIAEIMQKQLQNIGITCHLVTYDWGTYLYKIRHDEADLWMGGWMSDFGDPDNNLYTFFGGTTDSWAAGPPDQELYDLLIEAKSEPDVAKRTELYHQANQRIHDIALGVPVMHNAGAFAAKKDVQGVVPDPFYLEYWWIETSTGTFIWGRAGDAVGLDAWDETDGESFMVTNQIFEGLYARESGKTGIVPRLADGMPEVSADGLVWTIKLKEGIKFHDGTEFNADAVVFNIERAWDPNHPYRNTAHTNEYVYFSDFFGAFKGE